MSFFVHKVMLYMLIPQATLLLQIVWLNGIILDVLDKLFTKIQIKTETENVHFHMSICSSIESYRSTLQYLPDVLRGEKI